MVELSEVVKTPKPWHIQKGAQLWKLRTKPCSVKKYETPELLWDKCCEYFQWVEDNPLWEVKSYMFNGVPVQDKIPKMRAMTQAGLFVFLGITNQCWQRYRHSELLGAVVEKVQAIMWEQKFTGAAAEIFSPVIIARELGLRDTTTHEVTGANGGPIASITANLDPVEASKRYRVLIHEQP